MARRSQSSKLYQTTKRQFQVALFLLAMSLAGNANALIFGGTGNAPIPDPGWPEGAAAIFNDTSRVAYWEGPPFGGGQHHAECRGDAKAFNAILVRFSKLEVANKRLVVHDGVGQSIWLQPKREAVHQEKDATFDWRFMVWNPKNWERLSKMSPDINPTDPKDREQGPPTEITLYTGGNIRWADVIVPDGIEVVDNRLEAHGYTAKDGIVLEGTIVDLATDKPLRGQMELQSIESNPKGGYNYKVVTHAKTDGKGHWVLQHAPAGWHRVVALSEGYAPRVVGYPGKGKEPRWASYTAALVKQSSVAGTITDASGKPLPDVKVRLGNVADEAQGRYKTPTELEATTDEAGEFRIAGVPVGSATVHIHKQGYTRPGLGPKITVPTEDVSLQMVGAAQVNVVVLFQGDEIPNQYMVEIKPEGGSVVGSWGGSSNIDELNQVEFKNVPPGKYVLQGHPNPTTEAQKTKPITVDLQGGKTTHIEMTAW